MWNSQIRNRWNITPKSRMSKTVSRTGRKTRICQAPKGNTPGGKFEEVTWAGMVCVTFRYLDLCLIAMVIHWRELRKGVTRCYLHFGKDHSVCSVENGSERAGVE